MAEDPELPDLETVAEWVRTTRESVGLTLSDLGEEAHISPSQLSRLENSKGNPSYEAIYSVYQALKQHQRAASVEDVLRTKRNQRSGLEFVYVAPDDTCETAARLMEKDSISQLPVLADEQAVGSIRDRDLVAVSESLADVQIEAVMGSPFPEVPVTEARETVQPLLISNAAVLLTAVDGVDLDPAVGQYVGLLTAADFR